VPGCLGLTNTVLVVDEDAGSTASTPIDGALFAIASNTGQRSIVSDFGNSAQGPLGGVPSNLAVINGTTLLVSDGNADAANDGAIFQINSNGTRSILVDFSLRGSTPLGGGPSRNRRGAVTSACRASLEQVSRLKD
jgi:hypothetical protein